MNDLKKRFLHFPGNAKLKDCFYEYKITWVNLFPLHFKLFTLVLFLINKFLCESFLEYYCW
jgi:hypothetical protein